MCGPFPLEDLIALMGGTEDLEVGGQMVPLPAPEAGRVQLVVSMKAWPLPARQKSAEAVEML